jgi:hypothetical protein
VLSVGSCDVEPARNVGTEPCIESVFENDLAELDAAGTLAAAEANEHALITAETRRLHIAAHWADLHSGDATPQSRIPGTQHPARLGGEGTPTVADFAAAELGCVLRISDGSASRLIGDALDLRHRLPRIWAAAQAGQVPAHQARRIAAATRHLTAAQAGWVDAQLARPPPRTDLVAQSRRRLPLSRRSQPLDRYRPHHPLPEPRQRRAAPPTLIGNLRPHTRYHHRIKTHGSWQVRQPEPGTWLWRTPHHRIYAINATGIHPLGDSQFAQAIWRAASRPPERAAELATTSLR